MLFCKHAFFLPCPCSWIKLSSHRRMILALQVLNQRESKKRRAQKRQHVDDGWEDTTLRKKPKDLPQPEPLLHPSRPEDSEEEAPDEDPAAKQSQKPSIPRSAKKAKRKAEQRAQLRVTLEVSDRRADIGCVCGRVGLGGGGYGGGDGRPGGVAWRVGLRAW